MSEALNVNVLVSAKEEYTEQLCFVLSSLILQGIYTIFEESKKLPKQIRGVSYRNFQISLANIQNWSSFVTEKETKRIKEACKYLNDLVTAIFVSHVKILACVRLKGDNKNIKIKIPSMEIFIHKIYLLVGNKFYNNVYLINEPEEKLIDIISNVINECIRKQLPIEHILHEYLYDVFNDTDEDDVKEEEDDIERTLNGTDIVEDHVEESDPESDFEEEEKSIPVVPINASPQREIYPEPQFTDKIDMSYTHQNSFQHNENSMINSTPQIPQENPRPESPRHESPRHENPRPESPRPESPVTLFDDADYYST